MTNRVSRTNSNIAILLGAGASVEAGVPDARNMVQAVSDTRRHTDTTIKALNVAIGGLRFHRSVARDDPSGNIDVEDLYAVLRELADRDTSFLAPFVGSWSHAITSAENPQSEALIFDTARSIYFKLQHIFGGIGGVHKSRSVQIPNEGEIRPILEDIIAMTRGQGANIFAQAADIILELLVRLSWIRDDARTDYLLPLVKYSSTGPLWIATLNYDNAMELAARRAGCPIDLGIHDNDASVSFSKDSRLALAKLHGSINWSYSQQGTLTISPDPSPRPALIFGSGNKLQIYGPYLDLLFAFRAKLEMTDELHICGYSFRDQHVNHLILRWIEQDLTNHRVLIFDPSLSTDAIHKNIENAMPHGWRLFRGTLVNRMDLKPLTAGEWIAEYFAP